MTSPRKVGTEIVRQAFRKFRSNWKVILHLLNFNNNKFGIVVCICFLFIYFFYALICSGFYTTLCDRVEINEKRVLYPDSVGSAALVTQAEPLGWGFVLVTKLTIPRHI